MMSQTVLKWFMNLKWQQMLWKRKAGWILIEHANFQKNHSLAWFYTVQPVKAIWKSQGLVIKWYWAQLSIIRGKDTSIPLAPLQVYLNTQCERGEWHDLEDKWLCAQGTVGASKGPNWGYIPANLVLHWD